MAAINGWAERHRLTPATSHPALPRQCAVPSQLRRSMSMYVCECVVSKFLVRMDKYSNTHVFMGAYKSLLSYMYYCPWGYACILPCCSGWWEGMVIGCIRGAKKTGERVRKKPTNTNIDVNVERQCRIFHKWQRKVQNKQFPFRTLKSRKSCKSENN